MTTFQEILKQKEEESKKEPVSIPSDSIVKAVLTNITYTKKGKEMASIMGGIGLKFAYLGYYKDRQMKDYIQCIDYSDPENITFPIDRKNNDGTTDRPGLTSMGLYLSPAILKAKKYDPINDEISTFLLYCAVIGKQLTPLFQEPFAHALAGSGLMSQSFNILDVGLKEISTQLPIIYTFRKTWFEYQSSDIDPDTEKPVEGASRRFNEKLTGWDSLAEKGKENWLHKAPVELMNSDLVFKIYESLIKRNEEKRMEKEAMQSSSMGTPF